MAQSMRWATAALMICCPAAAMADGGDALQALVTARSDYGVAHFYRQRGYRPIWTRDGRVAPAAHTLPGILRDADDAPAADVERLAGEIDRTRSGDGVDLARAELSLSNAWVCYVRSLSKGDDRVTYVDAALIPSTAFPAAILAAAASAPSLAEHLKAVSRVNPVYAGKRAAWLRWRAGDDRSGGEDRAATERRLRVNLDRARLLPDHGKYIVVDASSARLWMFEDGQVRDTMKVVVGKLTEQTPMAAGLIRSMVLNPYWNVPLDLVQKHIAPRVLAEGVGYLRTARYELFSDWGDDARAVDPATIDWRAVAAGRLSPRVRQLPGGANAMGAMKFLFPNSLGVYLHDTPDKSLLARDDRRLSL